MRKSNFFLKSDENQMKTNFFQWKNWVLNSIKKFYDFWEKWRKMRNEKNRVLRWKSEENFLNISCGKIRSIENLDDFAGGLPKREFWPWKSGFSPYLLVFSMNMWEFQLDISSPHLELDPAHTHHSIGIWEHYNSLWRGFLRAGYPRKIFGFFSKISSPFSKS